MQLLVCPGYHSPDLTHDFLQSLLRLVAPQRLWVLPLGAVGGGLSWLFESEKRGPSGAQTLDVIAFSAGVVVAYPLVMAWQGLGGKSRLIAIDGWGMPLPGDLSIYRMSHDRWTHCTTYFPSPAESRGYFYAEPAVDHLAIWQSPQQTQGVGSFDGAVCHSMTALEFICAALVDS